MDCSPPVSFVDALIQARILEWVAILFSRGSSTPRDQTLPPALQADSSPTEPPVWLKYLLPFTRGRLYLGWPNVQSGLSEKNPNKLFGQSNTLLPFTGTVIKDSLILSLPSLLPLSVPTSRAALSLWRTLSMACRSSPDARPR